METRVIAQSPEELIKYSVRALIRRFHLSRDWIIGLIGERGSGKSLGGANIVLRDFMFNGESCWSNMRIRQDVEVDDQSAKQCELGNGGLVSYEAGYIDKQSFLALDSRYEGGCLFFDEFNLEYGEARRSSANVNLMTDRAIQQLRKMQCGLIYTVLNEMYVDARIRENTDVFIKCSDVAFNYLNLQGKMEQGVVFEWLIYPMSSKFAGNDLIYSKTHRPIGPIKMQMKHLWGVIDTMERQAIGATKYTDAKSLMRLDIKDTPEIKQEKEKYASLDELLVRFWVNHADDGDYITIGSDEFREELGISRNLWGPTMRDIKARIPNIKVGGRGSTRHPTFYGFPNRVLP